MDIENYDTTKSEVDTLLQKAVEWEQDRVSNWIVNYQTRGTPPKNIDDENSAASGGWKDPGRYYVGEFGPEHIYIPSRAYVTPTDQLQSGGSVTINQVINGGTGQAQANAASREMIRAMKKAGLL
jgi:hypothetical protein